MKTLTGPGNLAFLLSLSLSVACGSTHSLAASEAAVMSQIRLQPLKFKEAYVGQKDEPVSGHVVRGVMGGDTTSVLRLDSLNVFIPRGSWHRLTLQITTMDGRYQCRAAYPLDTNVHGRRFLHYPTERAEEVAAFRPIQLGVVALVHSRDASQPAAYALANWGMSDVNKAYFLLNLPLTANASIYFRKSKREHVCLNLAPSGQKFSKYCEIKGETGWDAHAPGSAELRVSPPIGREVVRFPFPGQPP